MYYGVITAPRMSASEICRAGFKIFSIKDDASNDKIHHYVVEGSEEALDKIDSKWGDWVWSLDKREDRELT